MRLDSVLNESHILVTMGPGGVGKTTLAALLGIEASVRGRKTLVLTIDPARRLADAFGLRQIPAGQPHVLSIEELVRQGVPARAPLTIAMLNPGKSLADVVSREVSDAGLRQRILQHPFFERLCHDLAGSTEYAAMEELYHLYQHGEYDLVVVDTPPTTQGIDFLNAPDRILNVLKLDGIRWLLRPALLAGKIGRLVLDFSGGYVVRILAKFTGKGFLRELASFLSLFSSQLEGFRLRAEAIKAVLQSSVTAFVLVTTPDPNQVAEVLFLYRRLFSRQLDAKALVVNRVVPELPPLPTVEGWQEILTNRLRSVGGQRDLSAGLARLAEAHQILTQLAERDKKRVADLLDRIEDPEALLRVSLLPEDVHDLQGLAGLRRQVFGSNKEEA